MNVINNGVQQIEDADVRRLLDTPAKVMQQLELQLGAVTAVAQKIFPTGNWDAGRRRLLPESTDLPLHGLDGRVRDFFQHERRRLPVQKVFAAVLKAGGHQGEWLPIRGQANA